MPRLLCLFIVTLIVTSCSQQEKENTPFTTSILAEQIYTISNDKDTILQTAHGSRINIAAGTFNNAQTQLEIREAFTPAEILAAGLTTTSNGRPLRSAGMIYINTVDKNEKPAKPIGISIPNDSYDSSMQVFKGVETDTGINWVNPQPVDTTPHMRSIIVGNSIFMARCASCHNINMWLNSTGPALAGVTNRWPNKKALHLWIKNNKVLQARGYPYAIAISKFSPTAMDLFTDLDDESIENVLAYIQNQAQLNRPAFAPKPVSSPDSANNKQCSNDTTFTNRPKYNTTLLAGIDDSLLYNLSDEISIDSLNKKRPEPEYYSFNISSLGWYNIDAFLKQGLDTKEVKLSATVTNELNASLKVYLFIPTRKVMLDGAYNEQSKHFYFDMDNETIALVPGDKAIVLAVGRLKDRRFIYGATQFVIKDEQALQVTTRETTETEIKRWLVNQKLEGVNLALDTDKPSYEIPLDTYVQEFNVLPSPCDSIPGILINPQ